MGDLVARTRAWMAGDPDPSTRAELAALIEAGDLQELAERMDGALRFGTAGLRAAVEAGSNRMNRATVIRTTAGLARYLLERHRGVPDAPVVVGRDARLSSRAFMRDAVAVLAATGLEVRFWKEEVPTPLVSYAVKSLDACAGVMITASHNPPRDNGYKVYDAGGAQIVPPVDARIAEAIDGVGSAVDIPRLEAMPLDRMPGVRPLPTEIWDDYRARVRALLPPGRGDRDLRIVYTPLHGVGWRYVREMLEEAGYRDVHPVADQKAPDGRFPTVAFPNPEEPGAMDLALDLAGSVGADLVLANDPDADRLAVAVPGSGGWVCLTGNQVGVLLADYLLSHHRGATPLLVSSIVSSPMAAMVGADRGARCETTLTGFKWIAAAAAGIETAGEARYVFGYEEALGYCLGGVVPDKDGVSAALAMADLAAECRRNGETPLDRLAGLYQRVGLWVSVQRSVRRPGSAGAAAIKTAMERLGQDPPSALAGAPVVGVTDYRTGATDRPRWSGTAPLVALRLDDGSRVLARPSGTEPKLKIYVDSKAPVPQGCDPFSMEAGLVARAREVADGLAGYLGL